MFRKIAVALIATSLFVVPALAAEAMKTVPAAKAETKAPAAAKAAVPVKLIKKHRTIRHRVYAGKHRKHVKHVFATRKPAKHIKAVTTKANDVRVVKTKKLRAKKHAAAVSKAAPGSTTN